MSRSGNKCAYVRCGKSARLEPGLKLYRFPKDIHLSRQWIVNCGKYLIIINECIIYQLAALDQNKILHIKFKDRELSLIKTK